MYYVFGFTKNDVINVPTIRFWISGVRNREFRGNDKGWATALQAENRNPRRTTEGRVQTYQEESKGIKEGLLKCNW